MQQLKQRDGHQQNGRDDTEPSRGPTRITAKFDKGKNKENEGQCFSAKTRPDKHPSTIPTSFIVHPHHADSTEVENIDDDNSLDGQVDH